MVSRLHATVTKDQVVNEFRCRAIREATVRVVGRRGLESATVQEIADEAGVAKGTIYLYFRSREELFERTTQAAVTELLDRLHAASGAGGTLRETLERVLTTQLGYFDERKDFFRLYFALGEGTEQRRQQKEASRRRHVAQLVSMLEAAATRGEIRLDDPDRTAWAIAGATREVILRRIGEKPVRPVAEDVAFLVAFVCEGISPARGRRR